MLIALKASATTLLLLALVPFQQRPRSHRSCSASKGHHGCHNAHNDHEALQGDAVHHNLPAPEAALARTALIPALNAKSSSIVRATIELGIVTALGSIFQAWGLSRIPATTAGFLIEGKAVLTPALAVLAGERISRRTQIASAAALVGALLTAVDGSAAGSSSGGGGGGAMGSVMLGSGCVLAAAACYSVATFRISVLSSGVACLCAIDDAVLDGGACPETTPGCQVPFGNSDIRPYSTASACVFLLLEVCLLDQPVNSDKLVTHCDAVQAFAR